VHWTPSLEPQGRVPCTAVTNRTIPMTDELVDYVHRWGVREHPVLAKLREDTAELPERQMQIGPDQGAFMALLVRISGARRILEIGTFTGYSSTAMALALPAGGRITCCDVSREWTDRARQAWADAGVADRVDLHLGPAAATLERLDSGSHDLAFIDADKPGYDTYYEECLRIVRPGGLILLDNTLQGGRVADPTEQSESVVAIRALNEKISADERVEMVLLPFADGLTLARVR
jgi:predicted O-methyltransferase YrrM